MRIRWTPSAADNLEQIFKYLQTHFPHFANQTVLRLYEGIQFLKASPYLGRAGQQEGTRELTFAPLPYLVVYRVKDEFIEVLHIYHGAQDRH